MLIFKDCDLQQAVDGAAFATFVASGQTCIMGARLIIHKDIYSSFLELLASKVKRIRMGDPFVLDTQMGPVISASAKARISGMVDAAVREGAIVRAGGCAPDLSPPFNRLFKFHSAVEKRWNKERSI